MTDEDKKTDTPAVEPEKKSVDALQEKPTVIETPAQPPKPEPKPEPEAQPAPKQRPSFLKRILGLD